MTADSDGPPEGRTTLQRSVEFYGERLDPDAWFRVAEIDYRRLIDGYDWPERFGSCRPPVRLLDVGCGTGRFPSMLAPRLRGGGTVLYDYLDPSASSLEALRASLQPPFVAGHALETTLEALEPSEAGLDREYQILWCVHSLYTLSAPSLESCLTKLRRMLRPPSGLALIYLAAQSSFYHRFYTTFREVFEPAADPYLTAEEVRDWLNRLGIGHEVRVFEFHHSVDASDIPTLETYLSQCAFDPRDWDSWTASLRMRRFLDGYRTGSDYRFPQEVWLLSFEA